MTYIVIDDDADATLRVHDSTPTLETVEELLRGMGWNRVIPDRAYGMCGWVSDVGHSRPDVFRRNVLASCVMATLGAAPHPLAGPLVITGYVFDDDDGFPDPAPPRALDALDGVYRQVREALGMPAVDMPHLAGRARVPIPAWATRSWVQDIREFAGRVAVVEYPTLRVLGSVDAERDGR